MFISITYAGLENTIDCIRDEIRYMGLLREELDSLYKQVESVPGATETLRECANQAKTVEESMLMRKQCLNDLLRKMADIDAKIVASVDAMESLVSRAT